MEKTVLLGLGGNIGDVEAHFRFAIDALAAGGLSDIRCSGVHLTPPERMPPETPDFRNAALIGRWLGEVVDLWRLCQSIEARAGRPNDHAPYADRPLDLDILLFGDEVIATHELTIPHPRFHLRRFALAPAVELIPDQLIPGAGLTISEALAKLP